ncbi:transcriptional regulator, XRE family [Acidothermus cellulolyticus 11B]|uniref:Transcriptional regulator, XRE family n=2 Tax=Acidothermus cellulolyticus TaxID=28049 RepID=A0LQY3_ACIC1|nr:transcriptional regulator, XRE family [Acidothermus cellulolyticus 11B]
MRKTGRMATPFNIGDFIREQRRLAQMSLRQLARIAGVSNPYLSQVERGLRRPSAEILQQIARGLRISAEALYVRAGILDERTADGAVVDAVLADPHLLERQKQTLLEIYDAFRKENSRRAADTSAARASSEPAASAADRPSVNAFAGIVDDVAEDGGDVAESAVSGTDQRAAARSAADAPPGESALGGRTPGAGGRPSAAGGRMSGRPGTTRPRPAGSRRTGDREEGPVDGRA